jgi:hypothetical protein
MEIIRPSEISSEGSISRNSIGTYFDSSGVLKIAQIDETRLNYNTATGLFDGVLVEPQATNLLTYSEELWDTTKWDVGSILSSHYTVTSSTDVQNAYAASNAVAKFVAASITSSRFLRKSISLSANNYNATILIYVPSQVGVTSWNLDADFADTETSSSSSVFTTFDKWIRVVIPKVTTTATRAYLDFNIFVNASTPSAGFTFYAMGAQLETGTAATSYIKTQAAAVIRQADIVTGSGLIWSDVQENDYPLWNAATSYTVGQRVIRITTHKVYENILAGIHSGLPENTPTRWLEVSPTNRWKLFDQTIGTSTEKATSMTYVLKAGRINSVALLALDAASVDIALSTNGEVVYSGSADLLSGNTVGDWYQYFYEPIYQKDSLVVTSLVDAALLNLPALGEAILTITIKYPSQVAKIGALVVGLSSFLGLTQYAPSVGIIDYSKKETDEFGNTQVIVRTYSKRMQAETIIKNETVDNVSRVLSIYRSTPLVWVGTDNIFNSLVVYGFCKDWEITVREPTVSSLRLDIEGLT